MNQSQAGEQCVLRAERNAKLYFRRAETTHA